MPEKKRPKTSTARDRLVKNRFSRNSLAVFVFIFAVVGGIILWLSFAAPAAPNVYLSATGNTTLPANTTFTVQVRETSGSTSVNAVQANVSYNAALLSFISVSDAGSAFSVDAQCTPTSCTPSGGVIQIGRGVAGGSPAVTGDQLVTTLTFKTLTTSGSAALAFTTGTALVSSTTNSDILGGLANTTGLTYTVDNTAPTVSVSSPANGATISAPGTTTVSITASDNVSVGSVDVYVDGTKVATLTTSPYNYSWNTTGLALGSHTLQAKATDSVGNVGSSAINTVTLADQTPPTTSITSPSGGSLLKGTVTVNANASDNAGGTGVAKVEFYVDGALKLTDTASPYSFSWDTTTATNASHSLTVKAYDNASPQNAATSAAVNITVDNSPPTTPGSFHSTGNTTTSISLAWTASSDNNGVTGYTIKRNGTAVTTTSGSTLSYTDSGLASGTSYSYTIVANDAAGNSSAAASLTASTIPSVPGDANGDGHVDATDLSILLTNYNSTTSLSADFNHDGVVNVFDLSILLSHYGT